MKGKTISIIVITALLTLFLVANNDAVEFNFLIGKPVEISKLIVIGICILVGFILGFIAGRPRKTYSSYNDEVEKSQANEQKSTLSDEDRDYIS